jgi:hypothetical protein
MNTMITQETHPLDLPFTMGEDNRENHLPSSLNLSDEQKEKFLAVENKYKQAPTARGHGQNPRAKGNLIPRKVAEMAEEVRIVRDILLKLGDYSSLDEDEDMINRIYELSQALVEVGQSCCVSVFISLMFCFVVPR